MQRNIGVMVRIFSPMRETKMQIAEESEHSVEFSKLSSSKERDTFAKIRVSGSVTQCGIFDIVSVEDNHIPGR